MGGEKVQDTPNLGNVQARFSGYTQEGLIGASTNQPIQGSDAEVLGKIFEDYPVYFADNDFRQKITTQSKENIEGQINGTCDQFDRINQLRVDNNLAGNLPEIIRNLSANLEEFRLKFLNPRKIDALEGSRNVGETLKQLDQTRNDAENIKNQVQEVLKLSQEFISRAGDTELADHFHRLYNGRTFKQMVDIENQASSTGFLPRITRLNKRDFLYIILVMALAVAVLSQNVLRHFIENDMTKLYIGLGFLIIILAIWAIHKLIKSFNEKYTGGYQRSSMLWSVGVVVSLIFVAIYSFFVVKALKINSNDINFGEAFIKAVVLIAPLYLVRFCARNFSANKHLATTNLQRAVSTRAFRPFIQQLTPESAGAQKEVYMTMTGILFKQDESGFITRKEGAGSSDTSGDFPLSR